MLDALERYPNPCYSFTHFCVHEEAMLSADSPYKIALSHVYKGFETAFSEEASEFSEGIWGERKSKIG